jgi:glycosyltransferase involved in cell wall biosynthesis
MPRRAPILHVTAPARFGGLERVVEGLLLGLHGRGEAVALLAILDPGATLPEWAQGLAAQGVAVHPMHAGGRRYDREYAAIRDALARERPAVVHTHGYRADVIAGAAARRLGLPTATTLHGFTRYGLKNRLFEYLQLRNAARSDAVIAVSAALETELAARGVPRERIALIPNRLGPSVVSYASREAARARLGLPSDGTVVGWMGRLGYEKDPVTFVNAFARLQRPGTLACVVGDGPERAAAEAAATAGSVGDALRFTGGIPDAGKLLAAFDVLVLSSRTEGTPMVVLEAAQAGTPVVATRVGGLPALLGEDGGWLVGSGDVQGLSDAIAAALDAPDEARRRALALQARLGDAESAAWLDRHQALYHRLRRDA